MLKAGERARELTLPAERTGQGCVLGGLHAEIEQAGMRVVGISPQSPESHAKFRSKYNLPFVLLSDQHKAVIKMYGVNGPLGIGVRRASYLVDGGRRIRDSVLADFMIAKHAEFVRKAILLRAANPQ